MRSDSLASRSTRRARNQMWLGGQSHDRGVVGAAARAERGEHVVRIGRQAEAGRDAQCGGGVRARQRAGVSHPQVEQVDAAARCHGVRTPRSMVGRCSHKSSVVVAGLPSSPIDDRGERRDAVVGHGEGGAATPR